MLNENSFDRNETGEGQQFIPFQITNFSGRASGWLMEYYWTLMDDISMTPQLLGYVFSQSKGIFNCETRMPTDGGLANYSTRIQYREKSNDMRLDFVRIGNLDAHYGLPRSHTLITTNDFTELKRLKLKWDPHTNDINYFFIECKENKLIRMIQEVPTGGLFKSSDSDYKPQVIEICRQISNEGNTDQFVTLIYPARERRDAEVFPNQLQIHMEYGILGSPSEKAFRSGNQKYVHGREIYLDTVVKNMLRFKPAFTLLDR